MTSSPQCESCMGRGKKMNEDRQVSEVDRVLVAPLAVYASWRQKEVRMKEDI